MEKGWTIVTEWNHPFSSCNCRNPYCSCGGDMKGAEPYLEKFVRLGGFKRIFEWGPGLTTRIFLRSCLVVEAVESEARWIPDLGKDSSRFICHLTPVRDRRYPMLWATVSDYDFYFVDGRRRSECMNSVLCNVQSPVLGIHDAQRERYHEAMKEWPYVTFITRGLAILSTQSNWVDVALSCRS